MDCFNTLTRIIGATDGNVLRKLVLNENGHLLGTRDAEAR